MTDNTEPTIEDELQKILEGLAFYLTSVAELSPFETLKEDKEEVVKARKEITKLISDQVAKARIDEVDKCGWTSATESYPAYAERRIAEIEATLNGVRNEATK